jgi:FAD synthase
LRGEVKFDGLEGLKAQLLQDKNKATALLQSSI